MESRKPKRYHIEFDIELSEDVRLARIENWARYHCGDKGRMRRDSPLYGKILDPICGSFKAAARK